MRLFKLRHPLIAAVSDLGTVIKVDRVKERCLEALMSVPLKLFAFAPLAARHWAQSGDEVASYCDASEQRLGVGRSEGLAESALKRLPVAEKTEKLLPPMTLFLKMPWVGSQLRDVHYSCEKSHLVRLWPHGLV